MGVIIGIILLIAIVGVIGAIVYNVYNENSKPLKILGLVLIPLVLMMIFIPFGFEQVNTGEIAVVKVFGEAKDIKGQGLHFTNIVTTRYQKYDLKTQDVRTEFESYTKDGQAIEVELVIQFRIKADKVLLINEQYGTLEILKQRIDAVGVSGTKDVLSKYEALPLIQNRGNISTEVETVVTGLFESYHIDVTSIVLKEITFTEVFENMIEEKMLAEQQRQKALIELEKQLSEATNKVLIAEQGALEKLAKAQAEAKQIELLAKAQAEALRLETIELARSLGAIIIDEEGNEIVDPTKSEILKEYLEYIAYLKTWDGKLPEIITGDNGSIIIPKK